MKHKPALLREQAELDVREATDHYYGEGGRPLELAFIDALESAFRQLAKSPGLGSPRYAIELDLPNLRSWPLKRFPYVIFYAEQDGHLDIWRVLHGRRDIPAWLRDDVSSE